mmetsp:Transcript_56858/g.169726  ORF Transcript_56858/g.169726 Transcript_56858/m.169726 type:complete len:88 (-) Transcript_56858:4221-4484(-)
MCTGRDCESLLKADHRWQSSSFYAPHSSNNEKALVLVSPSKLHLTVLVFVTLCVLWYSLRLRSIASAQILHAYPQQSSLNAITQGCR